MKLLALVANYCSEESYPLFRKAAEKFTQQTCETANNGQSLLFFDHHYKQVYQREFYNNRKKNSVLSVKILATTSKLITELEPSEKMLLSLLIADAIKNSKEQAAHVVGLHDVISETLGISDIDLIRLRLFTFSGSLALTAKDGFLIIDGLPSVFENHLLRENMLGSIVFVQVTQTKEIFFKLSTGSDTLYLEGQAIEPGTPYRFPWGSTLLTHKTEKITYALVHENLRNKRRDKQSFVAENISITNSKKQTLIHPFSFSANQGECIGITGSPGSGKSSLINCLMGLTRLSTGSITFEGLPLNLWYSGSPQWKHVGIIGKKAEYSNLTVFQYLNLHISLNNPKYKNDEINNDINALLNSEVGRFIPAKYYHEPLQNIQSHSFRFAIQILREIIRGSSILFADAPFEKLTLSESRDVCQLISMMNAKGCIFFISCARPSFDEFRMFDKLILLDKGYPVFWGNCSQVFEYFRSFDGTNGTYGNTFLADRHYNPDELTETIEKIEVLNQHEFVRKKSPENWYKLFLENCQKTAQHVKKNTKAESELIRRKKQKNSDFSRLAIILSNHFYMIYLQKNKIFNRLFINAFMSLFVTYILYLLKVYVYISNENLVIFGFIFFGASCGHWASNFINGKNEEIEQHLQLKHFSREINISNYLSLSILYVFQYFLLIAGLWYLTDTTTSIYRYTQYSFILSVIIFLSIRLQHIKKVN
jgi:ABC-type multidrug transport system ATPase subunit